MVRAAYPERRVLRATCRGSLPCRLAVTLLNRSPSAATVAAPWPLLGVAPSQPYSVRDVWAAADRGVHAGAYASEVPAHGVALLVLTPV